MAETRFKNLELKVGLFIFAALIMIVVLIFGFLISQDFFTRKVRVEFVAKSGEGLSKSMPVMYSGFQIARVHKVSLRDDGRVELSARIPERYKKWVKVGSTAKIAAQGVIGANAIVFSGGTDTGEISEGQTYELVRERAISDLLVKVEPMLNTVQSILDNVDKVSGSIEQKRPKIESLLDGVGAVGSDLENKEGSVGYLVRSDYLKNEIEQIVAKVKIIENNIQKITEAVNSRVDETKPVIQSFDKGLIAIKEGSEKIGNLAKDINTTVEKAQPTVENVNQISSDVADTTVNLQDMRKQTDEILNTTNRILLNLEEKWPFDNSGDVKAGEKVKLP